MRILLLLVIALLSVKAQLKANRTDSMLISKQYDFDRFSRKYPRERVYLHFDNTSYYKGENIWYKAYVVNDDDFHATDVSSILYVELLNPLGYPIETHKLKIENGQAHGSFLLADSINAGFYEVRAYTQWMLNFASGDGHGWHRLKNREAKYYYGPRFQHYLKGNASVFSRVFPVYEEVDSGQYHRKLIPLLAKSTSQLIKKEKDKLEIDFYPEGGNLVHGISTRVAFQAHNTAGRTLNVAGALVRRGDSIGYFKTDYAGRGVFHVTTEEIDDDELLADGLRLKLTYNGKNYTFRLPKSKRQGYVLNVFSNGNQVKTIVSRNDKTDGRKLGMNITCRGRSQYFDVIDLRQMRKAHIVLDKSSLTTGVNIVTLFDEEGQTLAQRMIFVDNGDMKGYNLRASLDTVKVAPYEKVGVNFQLTDADGRTIEEQQTFSVAVTDDNTRERTYDTGNILSGLLLSSELKGFIPHPAYYFEADDAEHRNALDMLMMVQGWTRYDYDEMMGVEDFKPRLAVEKSLMFRGRLWRGSQMQLLPSLKEGLGLKKSSVHFGGMKQLKDCIWIYSEFITDRGKMFSGEVKVEKDGAFYFGLPDLYDEGRFTFTLNTKSADDIGERKAGVPGHSFSQHKRALPGYMLDKYIEPLNQFSPLPKNYGYYETAALNDPWDENMFRKGYMAVPDNSNAFIYYDPLSQSYMLSEVTKTKRRKWRDLSDVRPVAEFDVDEMMAWLSNIYGSISEFTTTYKRPKMWSVNGVYNDGDGKGSNGMVAIDYMALDDKQDYLYNAEKNSLNNVHDIIIDEKVIDYSDVECANKMNRDSTERLHHLLKFDIGQPLFYKLREMLYIFGLDGMNASYYDSKPIDGGLLYYKGTALEEVLPRNMTFFPQDKNFTTMRLYADISNRSLMYMRGQYNEVVSPFDDLSSTNKRRPLTSIFNFVADTIYPNHIPQPVFLGYRINFQGYTSPAEFYSPDYSNTPLPEQTDYRRTVYWNPDVRTDDKGQAEIEFYNNGFSKKLKLSAEGITTDGITITTK